MSIISHSPVCSDDLIRLFHLQIQDPMAGITSLKSLAMCLLADAEANASALSGSDDRRASLAVLHEAFLLSHSISLLTKSDPLAIPTRKMMDSIVKVVRDNVKFATSATIMSANACMARCNRIYGTFNELEIISQHEARAIADAAEIEEYATKLTQKKLAMIRASSTFTCSVK